MSSHKTEHAWEGKGSIEVQARSSDYVDDLYLLSLRV